MKPFIKILGEYLLSPLFLVSIGFAQSQQGAYMHIDYLNIHADQTQSFDDQIKNIFKPIQEARIENDYISSLCLYKVAYP